MKLELKNKLLIIVLLFTSFLYSQDKEFEYVTSTNDGTEFYVLVEKTKSEHTNSKTEFWLKTIFPIKSHKNKKGQLVKTGGEVLLQYITLDCIDKVYDSESGVLYDRHGKAKSTYISPEFHQRIIPNTIMENIHYDVCSLQF